MRISIAQMNTCTGDLDRTAGRIVEQSRAAEAQGSRLLVCPVPVLTGPDPGGLSESEEYFLDLSRTLDRLAREAACPLVVPIVVDMGEGITFEAVLVRDGKVVPLRLASYLSALSRSEAEESDEDPYEGPVEFEHEGVSFGVAFDYAALDDFSHGAGDVDVIIYLPFYCYNTDDEASALGPSVADGCFLRDAADANAWIVCAGPVGGYDERVFTGGSFVLAPWGEVAALAPSFEEALLGCDVDPVSEGPLAEPVQMASYQRSRHLWDALVLATRDFVGKQGLPGVVVGLDGTLASSVVAALAVDALGPTRVHGLVLPCPDDASAADARTLAHDLRMDVREAQGAGPLASALDGASLDQDLRADLASALLALRAREVGGIVLSSEDKTASALDPSRPCARVAAFAPLGDVYRTDVATIARMRNAVSPVIPRGSLDRLRLPSGLGLEDIPGTPESRLNELDALLLLHVERGMGLSSIVEERANPEVAAAVLERVCAGELRRRSSGVPRPIVSDCTLSERAWPIALAWHDRVRPDWHASAGGEQDLRAGIEAFMRQVVDEGSPAERPEAAHDPADLMAFLHDFAQGGGLRSDSQDLWGQGLFSDN
ncbi:MAG: hypothetical protein LKE37_11115 [Atopobiaceae bacterium]|jgi:NAD+ synthase (glutamine-hydrolysing)|nr:hypothetical protein [Atopobiaceae bacterium]